MKVLITGATSGIGRQLALDYHHCGHEVWAIGRNQQVLNELSGLGIHSVQLDLTDREATLTWFNQQSFSLDIAILNAGNCEYVDLPEFDSALVERVFSSNVLSLSYCIEGLLPLLRKAEKPLLAGVGSSSSYLPLPRAEAYGASKAAVEYMLKSLAVDLKKENIDVSLICPGFVKTPLTDKNDFPMPFCMDVEEASQRIRQGLAKRKAEIHFPKRLTWPLKALSLLPTKAWLFASQGVAR